jgi:CheY-like chemotaxis protein
MMPSTDDLARFRVLVIEDEALIALDLVDRLRRLGFQEIRCAATLAKAVALAARWEPHLLTVDLRLPDGSGRDAVRAIRACDERVVAVYITGNPELLATEPDAIVLVKPCNDAELRQGIATAMARLVG